VVRYVIIGVVVVVVIAAALVLLLPTQHQAPVQYVGSPSGYEAFVPQNTINYKGNTDPIGDLILNNGTTIRNTIWNGQYSSTIIQDHDQIVQLNNQFFGQTDPVNNQPYVPLQDVYVVKGQVPIQQVTINGQPYTVIDANSINPADIAGFNTYQGWVPNFVAAINMPGTYAAGLPGNSPVFTWDNLTGTVAYQTMVYGRYGPFPGGAVLVSPNRTIISYGINTDVFGPSLLNFINPNHIYNPSS